MDIALSDRIEIRLEPEGEEWKPASSSDTVSHVFKSENRLEHVAAPKSRCSKQASFIWVRCPLLVFIALLLHAFLGLVIYLIGRYALSHQ